jgi:hypothetical protein
MKDIFSASQNVYEFGLRALAFPVRLQLWVKGRSSYPAPTILSRIVTASISYYSEHIGVITASYSWRYSLALSHIFMIAFEENSFLKVSIIYVVLFCCFPKKYTRK